MNRHGRACPGHPRLAFERLEKKDADARDRPGHDGLFDLVKVM
jgi:hypothetical protein